MPANYVLLEKVTLSANAASVTFSNIPQTGYTDLVVKGSIRISYAGSFDSVYIFPNGSTANGTRRALYATGGGTVGSESASNIRWDYFSANTATADTFGSGQVYIPNYTSSNFKSFAMEGVSENNSTATAMAMSAGLWSNTSAITSLQFVPNTATSFVSGSTFYLYGLAAVGTTPVIAPFASGGDIVTNDGTYWIHTFLSSGTFTPQKPLTCDALVIAGGGGSSASGVGGGGGAGGYRTATASSLTAQAYTVTVGAGGSGTSGTNTTFSTITSAGGGKGETYNTNGGAGGSGGGGGGSDTGGTGGAGNTPSTSPIQGYAGGDSQNIGSPIGKFNAGGGGGAGGLGGNGNSSTGTGGAGGIGLANSITGTSTYYASGGGGWGGTTAGTASAGGGANANAGSSGSPTPNNGIANTGGGGGGTGNLSGTPFYSIGGSGVVIIRYPIA